MGGSGTGGWEMLAREVKRSQKQLEAMAFKRAAMRAAMKDHRLRNGGAFALEIKRAEFPCFHLCLECNRLVKEQVETCPSCGKPALADLTEDDVMDLVRGMDDSRRSAVPKYLSSLLFGGLSLASVAATVFGLSEAGVLSTVNNPLLSFGVEVMDVALLALGASAFAVAAIATPAYVLLRMPLARLVRRLRPLPPARWRLPPRRRKAKGARETGRVRASEGLMSAPITKRPCVAYRLRAYLDAAGALNDKELILDECDAKDFQVAEVLLRGPSVLVDIIDEEDPANVVLWERTVANEGQGEINRFLRERGLNDTDGTVTFVESLVTVGDEVRTERTGAGTVIVTTSRETSTRSGRESPYR